MRPLASGAHQYVDRARGAVADEVLFGDHLVRFLYGTARERWPGLLRLATSARATELLALCQFDLPLVPRLLGSRRFLARWGVDPAECRDDPATFDTPRKIFERKLRFETCRPLPADPRRVVSPADARVVVGSLCETSGLFLKGLFFDLDALVGQRWQRTFAGGDFAVFRLTPEKYHYNHTPVAGEVVDVFEIAGRYHSCNPGAVVELATPLSQNRRVVTVIDTDVPGGTGVGFVAMIEVVALLIGRIEQGYCATGYDHPQPVAPGLFVARGAVKSLYRPGSSTDVLLFEPGRVAFPPDLLANQRRTDVASRFNHFHHRHRGLGQPLVETEVQVRSALAVALDERAGGPGSAP